MSKRSLIQSIFIAGMLVTGSAHAAFVEIDWNTSGDKKALLDEDTGIEWLKLDQTHNKSYNTVVSELSTVYAGWRLPTESEVVAFYSKIVAPLNININYTGGYFGQPAISSIFNFKNLMGQATNNATLSYLLGGYVKDNGAYQQLGTYSNSGYLLYLGLQFTYQYNRDIAFNQSGGFASTYGNTIGGTFLVNDGGVTLSSINNPNLNINNPNAPVIEPDPEPTGGATDVSVPMLPFAMGSLALLFGLRRRG